MSFQTTSYSGRRSRGKRPFLGLLATLLFISAALALTVRPPEPAQAGQAGAVYMPLMRYECGVYDEDNGLVVIEIESALLVDDWIEETQLTGYTGDSYYTWDGPDLYGTPGVGVLTYTFEIHRPAFYNFRLHNRHDYPDPTEQNDVWVRMDGGGWTKTFSFQNAQWTWATAFDLGPVQVNAEFPLDFGIHVLEISGRSAGFSIDRLVLYDQNGTVNGEDTGLPVSGCAW